MQIRITSAAAEEVAKICRDATVALEDAIRPKFTEKSYGGSIDQFSCLIVAVDSDATENQKWCKAYDKVGSFKHPTTSERVRSISFALPFDPAVVEKLSCEELLKTFCRTLLLRLENPSLKIPKTFDYETFATDLRELLEILINVKFEK